MTSRYFAIALLGFAPLLSLTSAGIPAMAAAAKSHRSPVAAPASSAATPATMLRLAHNTPVGASETNQHGTNAYG